MGLRQRHRELTRQRGLGASLTAGPQPIEQVFSKLKILLRKAEARTVDTVSAAIGSLLESFSPGEAQTTSETQYTLQSKSEGL